MTTKNYRTLPATSFDKHYIDHPTPVPSLFTSKLSVLVSSECTVSRHVSPFAP